MEQTRKALWSTHGLLKSSLSHLLAIKKPYEYLWFAQEQLELFCLTKRKSQSNVNPTG
jgi:hypothetical protein